MKFLEEIAIRLGWLSWALDPRTKPGLCPPECNESHTYIWPCRHRIRKIKVSKIGAWRDANVKDPLLDEDRLD